LRRTVHNAVFAVAAVYAIIKPEQSNDCDCIIDVADAGVKLEDSGNYTCEVRGHKSRLLATVTYLLFTIGQSIAHSLQFSLF